MGSPLGPVLANIFMIAFEKPLVQELATDIKHRKRCLHDTTCFITIE